MKQHTPPSIALVYDRVNTKHGGAERVLMALHELYPEAPLYTSLYDTREARWAKRFRVHTSFLQQIPGIKKLHRQFLILMPFAFSRLDLTKYDIVISITSAEAKAIKTAKNCLHVCYLLTPPRYLWSHPYEYQTGMLRPVKIMLTHVLRKWDYLVSQKPTHVIPISSLVRQRALKYYRRDTASPILPTITFQDQLDSSPPQEADDHIHLSPPYYLIISRLVSYKRIDIAIQACQQLKKRLVIVGDGPDLSRLHLLIDEKNESLITFIPKASDEELYQCYRNAQALLVPAEEDFGITVIESQRQGTPVVAYQHVGALDCAEEGKTVQTFSDQTVHSLIEALSTFEKKKWDRSYIRQYAQQFSKEAFQKKFKDRIEKLWYSHSASE